MANLLRKAAEHLQAKMENDASELIAYQFQDTGEWVKGVPAIVGQTTNDEQTEDAFIARISTRDFTIRAETLRNRKPQRNDVIRMGDDRYIVGADSGEGHFSEADPYGIAWRIHTKRDGTNTY